MKKIKRIIIKEVIWENPVPLHIRFIKPRLSIRNIVFSAFAIFFFIFSVNILLQQSNTQSFAIKDTLVKQTSIATAGKPGTYTVLVKKSSITKNQHLIKLPKGASNVSIKTISPQQARQIIFSSVNQSNKNPTLKQKEDLAQTVSKTENLVVGADYLPATQKHSIIFSAFSNLKKFFTAGLMGVSAEEDQAPAAPEVAPAPSEPALSIIQTPDANFVDIASQAPSQDETPKDDDQTPIDSSTVVDQLKQEGLAIKDSLLPLENTEPVVQIPNDEEYVQIDYQTQAPVITEEDTAKGKSVTISAVNEDPQNPLTDVLAFTKIPEIYSVGQESKIKVKWKNPDCGALDSESQKPCQDQGYAYMPFNAHDTNSNGKIDYIEWTVPHLSEQDFEIIFISKAFQLDQDKNIIADISSQVHDQDNTYAPIESNQYVRATFASILNHDKDITLYAKPLNPDQPVTIEVYPIDQDGNIPAEPIATFDPIDHDGKYRILLTNLQTPTDTFDLKVTGNVEIDQILDPGFACTTTGTAGSRNWSDTTRWTNCNGSYPGSVGNGNTDTVTITNGFTMTLDVTPITISTLTINGLGTATTVALNGNTLNVSSTVTINKDTTGTSILASLQVGTGTLNATGSIALNGAASGGDAAVLSASTGTITANGGIDFSGSGAAANGQLTTTGAATINLIGTISSGGTLSINAATNLAPTGTSTISGAYTFGKLSLLSGTTTMGGVAVTFAGTTTINGGTLAVSSATGTKTFTGAVTVTTGSFDLSGFATVTSFAAGITMNGTTFNTGTGTATLSATQALAGSSNMTFGGAVTLSSGATITNNNTGTVTATGALTFTGNWTQGANSTLSMGSTNSGSGTLDASTNTPNTVKYGATATLKTPTLSYYNLTITAGTITSVTVTISNDLVVSGGTFSGTANIVVNGGDATGDGTITMTGGIFMVDGTGNFGGATAWTFYNLQFGDGTGSTTTTATGAGAITASNNMYVAASQTLDAGSKTWNLNGTGVPGGPSIAFVRPSTQGEGLNSATATTSFSVLPVVGDHVIVTATVWNDPQPTSITFSDNQGNSYTTEILKADPLNGSSGAVTAIGSAKVVTSSGTFTVTVTPNGASGNYIEAIAMEYSGLNATSWLDKTGSNNWAASANAATVTASAANTLTDELVVVSLDIDANDSALNIATPTSSYNQRGIYQDSNTAIGFESADKIVTTAQTSSAAWNHDSARGAAVIATYLPAITGALKVSGTFTANASTVTFGGNGATTIPALTYYNLTFAPTITAGRAYTFASGTTTVNNNFDINPTAASALALTVSLGGTLNVTGSVTIEGTTSGTSTLDTTSGGNYSLSAGSINIATAGTFTPQASTITLTGTSGTLFTKTGTFTVATSTFVVTSSSGQPLLLSAATTFHILKINTTGGSTVINANQTITIDDASGAKLWVAAGVLNDSGFGFSTSASTTNTLQVDSGTTLCLGGASGSNTATTCDTGTTSTTARSLPTFHTYTLDSASTIIYLSDAATTVTAIATPGYGNLTLRPKLTAGRAYTMGNSSLVAGNFDIIPTTGSFALTATLGSGGLTVTGLTTVEGSTSTSTLDTSLGNNYAFSTGTLSVASGSTLNIRNSVLTITGTSGTLFTRAGTFTIGGTSTTNFSGNGDATLNSGTITFDAMTNSGTGTKTLGAAITTGGALTISAGTLQLSTFDLTANSTTSLTGTLNDNSATGTNLFVGAVTINSGGIWTETNNPAFEFRGGLTNNSSSGFTSGTGVYTFSTNAQTISGSQSFTITNLTNSVTSSTGLTFSGAQPTVTTLTQGSSAQLTFSGTMPTITTLTATASSNTVSYTNTSAGQTVKGTTYVNLTIDNSGQTATLGGDTTLNGALTITAGTLQLSTPSFTVTGASSISGTLNDNSATGTNTFTGAVTINSGGIWTETNNPAFTFQGGLTENSSSGFTSGTGVYTFDTNAQTISGSQSFTITNLTNNVTSSTGLTFSGAQPTVTTLTQGTNAYLTFSGNTVPTITTLTATASGNTVEYSAASQAVKVASYVNLTLSGSGTATGAVTTVTGALSISGTVSWSADAITSTMTSVTVNTTGALTIGANMTTSGALTLTKGTFSTSASNFTVNAASLSSSNTNTRTLTMGSGLWTLTGTGTVWTTATTTGLTLTSTTSTIKMTDSTNTASTFAGGSLTFGSIWWARGTSTASNTISGSNTFSDFKDDGSVAHSILFTNGTTTTVTTFTVSGSSGNVITINSDNTSTHTLTKSGGGVISSDYLNIQHSVATPSSTWYAGAHSTDNNSVSSAGSGWIFTIPPCNSLATGNWNTAGTWSCGHVPTTGDIVTVVATHVVTMDVNSAVLGTITINGTLNTSDGTSRTLSVTTLTIGSAGTLTANASVITLTGTSGTLFTITSGGIFTQGTSEAVVTSAGDTTLNSAATSFYKLTFNNSGNTTTLGAATTVDNNLTITAGTLQLSTLGLTVTGTTSLTGTLNDNSATGTNLFVGAVTINSGGIWTETNNPAFEFRGGLTNNSSSGFTSGTGVYTFSTNAQTISGSQSFTITNLTNSVTSSTGLTFSGAQPTVTTLTQGSSAQLTFSGTMPTITTLTATASSNTVSYTNTSAGQTVKGTTYVNLTIVKSSQTGTLGADTTINGVLTITSGTFDTSTFTLTLAGTTGTPLSNSGTFTSTGAVSYTGNNGSGNTTVANVTYYNLIINNASETFVLAADTTVGNNLTITAGTLDAVSGQNYNLSVTGNWSNSGTFTPRLNTVTFKGTGSQTITSGGSPFYNLTQNDIIGTGTYTLQDALSVSNNLTVTHGTLDTKSSSSNAISVGGNFTISEGFTPNSGTVTLTGTGSQTISIGAGSFYNLTQSGSGGTYTLLESIGISNVFTITAGTFNADAYTIDLSGTTGTPFSNSGIFTASTGSVSYSGNNSGGNTTIANVTYYTLILNNASETYVLAANTTVNNNFNILAGIVDAVSGQNYTLTVGGTWSNSGTFTPRQGTVTLTGTSTFSDTTSFYNVTINGSGKTVTLGAALTASNNVTITAGTLDASGTNYNVTAGAWSNSGTFTPHSDTLTLTNTGTLADTTSFYNLTINGSGKTVTLGAGLTTTNNLTITAGTLDVSASGCSSASCAIIVKGDWTNAGTFTARTGLVTFNGTGTQNINSDNTWYRLSVTASSARTTKFESGKTQTIGANGTVTFNGASGQLLTLAPKTAATPWNLTVNNTGVTQSISYITPSYSDASGGATITANDGTSTNGGNNTNWNFNTAPSITSGPSDGGALNSPVNVGSSVAFTATATDTQSDGYYLAICKTNAISANDNAVPTCTGGNWGVSSSTTSGSQASVSYTTLAGDSQTNVWYAFVCDNTTFSGCSSSNQGLASNGSPFEVNHMPTFSAISNTSGSITTGSAVTFTATASDADTGDTVTLYVCKSNDFTGTACGAGGTWCSSSASTSDPTCSYTVQSGDTDGSHTYYGNIIDSNSFVSASNPRSSTFTTSAASSGSGSGSSGGGGGNGGVAGLLNNNTPPPSLPPAPPTVPNVIQQIINPIVNIGNEIGNIFIPKPKPPVLPPAEQVVKKEAPLSLQGKWNLVAFDSIREFLFAPLPTETKALAKKIPEVNKLFKETGIATVNSTVQKLQGVELTVPTLGQRALAQNIQVPSFALPKNIPLTQLSANIKKVIPTEIVFARTANELIDFNVILSINGQGQLQQRINTISGQEIKLAVKPEGPVNSVKGYFVLKSKQPEQSAFQAPRNVFAASLLFSNPNLVALSQGPPKIENQLLVQEFDYQDSDNDGIYTANVKAPAVDGEYEVITIMNYKDVRVGNKEIRLIVVVDPEGYVYSNVMGGELRINGAIVSLYWLNPATKNYEVWPAKDYQQENPQVTNKTGKYAFLAPEGSYYIEVSAPNYSTLKSDVFTIKENNGVHMNIELKSNNWWMKYLDWKTILLALIFLALIYIIIRGKIRVNR